MTGSLPMNCGIKAKFQKILGLHLLEKLIRLLFVFCF